MGEAIVNRLLGTKLYSTSSARQILHRPDFAVRQLKYEEEDEPVVPFSVI